MCRLLALHLVVFTIAVNLSGCSDDDSSSGGSTTQPQEWSVLTSLKSASTTFGNLMPDTPTAMSVPSMVYPMAAAATPNFNDDWATGAWVQDPYSSTVSLVAPRAYLSAMLNADNGYSASDSPFNIFAHVQDAVMLACAITNLTSQDANGYPVNTTTRQTLTFTTAHSTTLTKVCGLEEALPAGMSVLYEVADVTGGLYDKKISLKLSVGSPDNLTHVFIRATATQVNIMSVAMVESDWAGGSSTEPETDSISRTMIQIDKSTGDIKVEHIALSDEQRMEFHRGHYTKSSDSAYILGFSGHFPNATVTNAANSGVRFVLAGKSEHLDQTTAVSFGYDPAGSGEDYTVYNACVNPQTGGKATDGTLMCGITGVSQIPGTTTVFATVAGLANGIDVSSEASSGADLDAMFTGSDETTDLSFDGTSFKSAAPDNL